MIVLTNPIRQKVNNQFFLTDQDDIWHFACFVFVI